MLLQNGQFNTAITNIKPMYTIGNDLIYKYDKETQFWAGNEYLFFENKDVRAATNNVGKIDTNGSVYNTYLYPNYARAKNPYTYFPDANGNFIVKNINAEQNDVEADYTWVFFTFCAFVLWKRRYLHYRNVQQQCAYRRKQNGLQPRKRRLRKSHYDETRIQQFSIYNC